MKALVKKSAEPGLWLEDVPIPSIRPNEVIIKIHKTSICGTDVHIYKWDAWAKKTILIPTIIGHEFSGVIEKIGSQVKTLKVGERVTAEGHLTCGICPFCKQGKKHLCPKTIGIGVHQAGCFAEYMAIPSENVIVVPTTISEDIVSILDPFGNAVHAAFSVPLITEDVLITGAGPIGMMAAAVAHHAGAHNIVISDRNSYRLNLACQMGAHFGVNIEQDSLKALMRRKNWLSFSVGLELSGHPDALISQIDCLNPGSHLALLGIFLHPIAIDWNQVIFKMLHLKGIYGREIFSTWYKMISLIESGLDLTPIITHQFAAEEFEKGFEVMLNGLCGKVILHW